MRARKKTGRNALALALSVVTHVVVLDLLAHQVTPNYVFPPSTAAPMDVEIVSMPKIEPIPPPPPPPRIKPPKEKPVPTKAPPTPERTTAPPAPQPPKPEPAKPAPPKPSVVKPAPVKPAPTPPAPSPRLAPTPSTPLAQTKPATQPKSPAPPSPTATPSPLNIHRPALATPSTVPTLPMAPAAGQTGRPAGAPAAPGASPPGGSRLSGLNPWPAGAFPSGGGGLRGTLVGCANADRVKLTSAERTHCNERFGESMAHAPTLDGINPAKRAGFDRDAASQDMERRYRASTVIGGAPTDIGGGVAHGPASTITPIPHDEGPH